MSKLTITTNGLPWEEVANDFIIITAKLVASYGGKDFLFSKYFCNFLINW